MTPPCVSYLCHLQCLRVSSCVSQLYVSVVSFFFLLIVFSFDLDFAFVLHFVETSFVATLSVVLVIFFSGFLGCCIIQLCLICVLSACGSSP